MTLKSETERDRETGKQTERRSMSKHNYER